MSKTITNKTGAQIHAGHSAKDNKALWHMDSKATVYWSGMWGERTPQELYSECQSTMRDLRRNHPELV